MLRDITDRKRMESQVAESEERYRVLVDTTSDLIFSFDRNLQLTGINRAAAKSVGLPPEEALGRLITDLRLPKETQERWQKKCREVLAGGQAAERLLGEFVMADGRAHTIETDLQPIHAADGSVVGVRGVTRDISERHQAETALRDSERRYRTLFDSANDGVIIHAVDGTILEANRVVAKRLGRSHGELLGLNVREMRTPKAAGGFAEQMEAISRDGNAIFETSHRGADGGSVPVEVSSRLLDEGDSAMVLSISRDITERKRAEEALRAGRVQLENAMDLASLVNWDLDVETRTFMFNDRFYALYGTSAEREGGYEMPAETYAQRFIPPDEQGVVAQEMEGSIKTSDPDFRGYVEHRIVRRDGEVRHVAVSYVVTKDEHGRTVTTHGVNQDVTERKRGEEALELAEAQLRQSQKMEAVGQLAGGIAHDFNNLLTVIIGNSELVLQTMPWDDPNRELEVEVKAVGERAAALTRQILAFSRRQMLKPEVLCLNDVVHRVEPLLHRTLGEDIDLMVLLAADLGIYRGGREPVRASTYEPGRERPRRHAARRRTADRDGERRSGSRVLPYSSGAQAWVPRSAGGLRQRLRHGRSDPHPGLRALFHHQRGGQGHGLRSLDRARYRRTKRGQYHRLQRARQGDHLQDLLADPQSCRDL